MVMEDLVDKEIRKLIEGQKLELNVDLSKIPIVSAAPYNGNSKVDISYTPYIVTMNAYGKPEVYVNYELGTSSKEIDKEAKFILKEFFESPIAKRCLEDNLFDDLFFYFYDFLKFHNVTRVNLYSLTKLLIKSDIDFLSKLTLSNDFIMNHLVDIFANVQSEEFKSIEDQALFNKIKHIYLFDATLLKGSII